MTVLQLRLKSRRKTVLRLSRPAQVLHLRPRDAAGVPDEVKPFLNDIAAMVAAAVVRDMQRPKLRLRSRRVAASEAA